MLFAAMRDLLGPALFWSVAFYVLYCVKNQFHYVECGRLMWTVRPRRRFRNLWLIVRLLRWFGFLTTFGFFFRNDATDVRKDRRAGSHQPGDKFVMQRLVWGWHWLPSWWNGQELLMAVTPPETSDGDKIITTSTTIRSPVIMNDIGNTSAVITTTTTEHSWQRLQGVAWAKRWFGIVDPDGSNSGNKAGLTTTTTVSHTPTHCEFVAQLTDTSEHKAVHINCQVVNADKYVYWMYLHSQYLANIEIHQLARPCRWGVNLRFPKMPTPTFVELDSRAALESFQKTYHPQSLLLEVPRFNEVFLKRAWQFPLSQEMLDWVFPEIFHPLETNGRRDSPTSGGGSSSGSSFTLNQAHDRYLLEHVGLAVLNRRSFDVQMQ